MRTTLLKPLGLMLIVLLVWAGSSSVTRAAEAKMNVAVVEFSVMGDMHEQAGAIIADMMMANIANSGRFNLKDRLSLSAVSKIAKAQELGYTGLLDPRTAADLGQRYGLDAVVIGAVSKPGDLITVTARLIDTKTALLLRSGQIQGKNIDTIQEQISQLAAMIAAPPEPAKAYGLTVRTEPPSASIRLLNSATPYQPGVRLPPGDYEIEVSQAGYAPRQAALKIVDRDLAVTVTLDKAKYGLTVRTEPADAQIRLLNAALAYQPGVELTPGDYQIEVTKPGYAPRTFPIRIVDSALTVPVTLEKQPEPAQYRLTVQTDPPQATVKLLNLKTSYQPGLALAPGRYSVEVSQAGYETQRLTVTLADSDVTVPVTLTKQSEPERYRLTVRPDPANAKIRLVGVKAAYKPGVALAPGRYTVEVSQTGYETQRLTVTLADSDVTAPVTLTKEPEPERYRLTVRPDPANAKIRLVGVKAAYKPGVTLAPGRYTVEVSQAGYETQRLTVTLADSDVTVPVTLTKEPEPERYRLTVRPDPADARVRLLGTSTAYRPGVALAPGSYTVEVSRSGYDAQRLTVRIADSDVTMPVALAKQPEPVKPTEYRLTVRVTPSSARVRLVNSSFTYRPGVTLPPGNYTVEASGRGYETERRSVRIIDSDVTESINLQAVAKPELPESPPPTRPGTWRIGSVQVDGSISGADRSEVQRVLNRYIGQTASRDSLLDSAMQVYRSTGITLSFAVRNSASGSAELSARVSQRLRRTYESSVPLVTRGQLERSGFAVSVD